MKRLIQGIGCLSLGLGIGLALGGYIVPGAASFIISGICLFIGTTMKGKGLDAK